jgi:hypothetical protein
MYSSTLFSLLTIQFSFCASVTKEIIYTQQNERYINKQQSLITVPKALKAESESEKHTNSVSASDPMMHRNWTSNRLTLLQQIIADSF